MPMTPMPVLPQAAVLAVPAVHGNAARLRRSALSPADPYCRKRPYWSSPSRPVLLQAAVLVCRASRRAGPYSDRSQRVSSSKQPRMMFRSLA